MREYFPLFISLKGKEILFIGGGKVAERKIKTLLRYSPQIKVIAPEITEDLKKIVRNGLIIWKQKTFDEGDLEGNFFLVVTAVASKEINDYIHKLCEDKNILVNNATGRGRVIFPSIVEEGEISVAISTAGAFPFIAKTLKNEIKDLLNPYSKVIKIIKPLRSSLLTANNVSSYNKKILRKVFSLSLPKIGTKEGLKAIREELNKILQQNLKSSKKL